jgi:tRNA (Thr-GGU) A37 N-methylase
MKFELTRIGLIHSPHRQVEGTPLLDIKPYVPDCDVFTVKRVGWWGHARNLPTADDRFAHEKPNPLP